MRTLFLSLALAVSARAESVTLKPSQDSDVYAFFDAPSFSIFDLNVGASGTAMTHSHHALVEFNLATLAIPAAEIATAKLRLFVLQPDSTNGGGLRGGNVAVHRQGVDWAVAGLRWSHLQGQEQVGLIPVTQASVNNWVELDVTALVKGWAAGTTPNHGFLLKPESETQEPWMNVLFASMEITNFAPQLVITRQEMVPELSISRAGGGFVLEWPTAVSGWTLQQAESLTGPWTASAEPVASVNGMWRVVHAPHPSGRAFFRLAKS